MHRPETEKDAAPLGTPVYSGAGTDGIWTKGSTASAATRVDEEFLNDWTENVFEVLARGGVSATKGRKEDLADAIGNLVGQSQQGVIVGRFEYAAPNAVQLSLGIKGKVRVEIDDIFLTKSSVLTFHLPFSLFGGVTESPNTWYYAYANNLFGLLQAGISDVPPKLAQGKGGYHPSLQTWRFIGAFYNDASSNIVPFDTSRTPYGWETRFRRWPFGTQNPGTGGANPGNYTKLLLNNAAGTLPQVPESAREVLLFVTSKGAKGAGNVRRIHWAIDRDLPKNTNDDGGQAVVSTASDGPDTTGSDNLWVPLDDASSSLTSPAVAWAIEPASTNWNTVVVIGFR